jgi:hypothetical protein
MIYPSARMMPDAIYVKIHEYLANKVCGGHFPEAGKRDLKALPR